MTTSHVDVKAALERQSMDVGFASTAGMLGRSMTEQKKELPMVCPLAYLSPCSFGFSNMDVDNEGVQIYIYVCHAHQHGTKSYTKIPTAHDTFDDYDWYDYGYTSDY